MMSVCPSCGDVFERDSSNASECLDCRPSPERVGTSRHELQQSYDHAWRKLSRRARRIQPFCSDCNTTDDLTCDHLPEAWRRHERGLPIRLQDVDVVCRSCNSARGAARGDRPTWQAITPRGLPDLAAVPDPDPDPDPEPDRPCGCPGDDPHLADCPMLTERDEPEPDDPSAADLDRARAELIRER